MGKPGNPTFARKAAPVEKVKDYRFVLCQQHDSLKPVNNKTGQSDHNPYPPMYFVPNEGVAYNKESGDIERFRYIYGYPSIWLKDQDKPEPSKQQIESPENVIMFTDGFLKVSSKKTALLEVLKVSDFFEGNKDKVNEVPPIYRLIDAEAEFNTLVEAEDKAYEAQKFARECTVEEMLPIASVLGIDVQNGADDEEKIRKHFIMKAKAYPPQFLRESVNPKNKIKYLVAVALRDNVISSTEIEGKLVYTGMGKVIASINPHADVSEQIAQLVISRDTKALEFYEQLKLTSEV